MNRRIEWVTCLTCGKRYVVRIPPASESSLEDLEKALDRQHVCRTDRQERALADYAEGR